MSNSYSHGYGLEDGDIPDLRDHLQKHRSHGRSEGTPTIDPDHPMMKKVGSYLATQLFVSDDNELYIRAKYLADQIDSSSYKVTPALRSIRDGEVEGLEADIRGSNQSASTWKVWIPEDSENQ